MNYGRRVVLLLAMSALPVAAQAPVFDSSGNGQLSGTYYFREVIALVADSAGDVSDTIALYGNISFDGNGNYTITNADVMDGEVGQLDPLPCYLAQTVCALNSSSAGTSVSGTYTISASGYGSLVSPVSKGDSIFGMVSNGVFIGSSTESGFNDLFIAAKLGSPQPSNSTFQGSWTFDGYLPPLITSSSGGPAGNAADTTFQAAPDAAGNVGNLNITGYYGFNGSTGTSQSISGVKYSINNGAVILTFPNTCNTNNLIFYCGGAANPEYLYFSPDGNFVFGGAASGYDMVVGVRNNSAGSGLSGLYYTAGFNHDFSAYAAGNGFANLTAFYGAINANNGNIVGSDRIQNLFNSTTYDASYQDTYQPGAAGYNDTTTSLQYTVGDNGLVRIGFGSGPYLGLTVAVQAPSFNQTSSVFINPAGIVSNASFVPFVAGVAPGEMVAIFGANLAPSAGGPSTLPLPPNFNGVQVFVNGTAAPIYYVSPGQIVVQVPYVNAFYTNPGIANFQVNNNGVSSNVVSEYVDLTHPGIFTGGGLSAVLHANNTLVTTSNPAAPGETLQVFMTGLGQLSSSYTDGAAAPAPPIDLYYFDISELSAYVGGLSGNNAATVQFGGLAPGFASLNQVNITVPATAAAGNQSLQIYGPDSGPDKTPVAADYQRPPLNYIAVGAGSFSASETAAPATVRHETPKSIRPRKPACFFGRCSGQ